MLFIKIYIHFVWNQKKRTSILAAKEIRKTVWNHIRETANANGIRVDYINGYFDHYRCLIALDHGYSVEKMMEILKGEKTFWINRQGLSSELTQNELPPIMDEEAIHNLELQDSCFTIVIGESETENVTDYINEFVIEYGFQKMKEEYKFILGPKLAHPRN